MKKACTFFGHRECPDSIKPELREALIELIENCGVNMFYVGNQGQFDAMVRRVLKDFKLKYPHIDYAVVLAYPPAAGTGGMDYSDTLLPEGIETVYPRFAISWRNRWMLSLTDIVRTRSAWRIFAPDFISFFAGRQPSGIIQFRLTQKSSPAESKISERV